MIDNIHKWLLLRLALLWLVLSIVIGGMVNYLGHLRMDNHIVEMAKTETSSYIAAIDSYLKSPSEQALSELNSKIGAEIIRDNLIAVEFYGADSNKITEVVKQHAKEIEANIFCVTCVSVLELTWADLPPGFLNFICLWATSANAYRPVCVMLESKLASEKL